jgi:hypothetical protein
LRDLGAHFIEKSLGAQYSKVRNHLSFFISGEILRMTHVAQGIDKDGNLDLDIIVTGYVPDLPPTAKISVEPYTEEYIQTGPGN